MISFSVLTLGCKVNSYESEAVINDLIKHGWELRNFRDLCDVYIINTCTVTSTSDQKSRQMLHAARRRNTDSIVVAMGCYSQLNCEAASKIADIVLGTNNKMQIYDIINSYLETKMSIMNVTNVLENPTYEEMKINNLVNHTRAFIKIQDGCENYCSYCAIPYSRGKIRSRRPENIIEEIKMLVAKGTKEVIFAGINTGTYGQDLGNINLAGLLKLVMEETDIYRVRFSSIEVMEVTSELLAVIKQYETRVAMHFHIPLQGGSDSILIKMKRKYLTDFYEAKITEIRNLFDEVSITTDILAGFVSETEEEFNQCLAFVKKINFYDMHVFPYSRRKNTIADTMEGHLPASIINNRAKILLDVAKEMKINHNHAYIGKTVLVLVENMKSGMWKGHTSNYLEVCFVSTEKDLVNKIIKVKITHQEDGVLYGNKEGENE